MSDAQETDARQKASVLRALEEEGYTPASARSYAAQSSELLDPRCNLDSSRFELSYFEGVPVTTYRQVNNIQASQAFMPGSAVCATRGGCELSVPLLESVNVEIWGGTSRSIVRDLEAIPVGGYSGAVTSVSEGAEEVSTCVGHLPAEGRDLMSKGCCKPAEGQDEIRRLEVVGALGCKVLRFQYGCSGMGELQPARAGESLQVQHEKKSCTQCDDAILVRSGWKDGYALRVAVLCERCSSTSAGVGDFLEEKDDTPRNRAGYLAREDVLAHPEHVLEQAIAHMNTCDAESFICIEAALGGGPQCNVTSVGSTPTGSRKWVQEVPSGEGHEPVEGSDLNTSYCGDRLAERDLDIGQLGLEPQTSLRQRSCGTQAVRRSSAAHDASTRLGRFDYLEWTGASGRGWHAVPLDRHGGRPECAVCVKVFDPGGRVVCRV